MGNVSNSDLIKKKKNALLSLLMTDEVLLKPRQSFVISDNYSTLIKCIADSLLFHNPTNI